MLQPRQLPNLHNRNWKWSVDGDMISKCGTRSPRRFQVAAVDEKTLHGSLAYPLETWWLEDEIFSTSNQRKSRCHRRFQGHGLKSPTSTELIRFQLALMISHLVIANQGQRPLMGNKISPKIIAPLAPALEVFVANETGCLSICKN